MTTEKMPDSQPFDDATVEAVLTARQSSGDAALDNVLSALRAIGHEHAPELPPQLRAVLLGQPAPAAGVTPMDEARGRRTKHIASGSAAVGGILLMSATTAAAIGGPHVLPAPAPTHGEHSRTRPAGAPTAEPHATRTMPTDLPIGSRLAAPAHPTRSAHEATASGDDDQHGDAQNPVPPRTDEGRNDSPRAGETHADELLAHERDEGEPSTAEAYTDGDSEDDEASDGARTAPTATATTDAHDVDDLTQGGDGDG